MLNTLPYLPHAHLPGFLSTLTPLASSHPSLFEPHLPALLKFLPALILPSVDSGPTPTVARPNPDSQSFTFPPPDVKGKGPAVNDEDEETTEVRKAALEFMVSLTEARPSMVRRVDGWTAAVVRGCLEGMGEIPDDEMERTIQEFSHPGTSRAVPRYFNSSTFRAEWLRRRSELLAAWKCPVLIMQGYDSKTQPREFYENAREYIPNAKVSYLEYDAACATKHKTDIEAAAGGTLYIGNPSFSSSLAPLTLAGTVQEVID